jgi:hypothetical protein
MLKFIIRYVISEFEFKINLNHEMKEMKSIHHKNGAFLKLAVVSSAEMMGMAHICKVKNNEIHTTDSSCIT